MNKRTAINASVLGLADVLSKKPTRDLDDLASIDLAAGVQYPTPANQEPERETSKVAVIANPSHESVGLVSTTGKMRLPDGSFVRYERRVIAGADLAKVLIYKGNPRATTNPDITALRGKIARTGGNIIPVTAHLLDNGTVEVIAGSRRTRAVKEEGLALLADVILDVVSEVNCRQLAYIENDGREDPDVFDEATFFSTTYEAYKDTGLVSTIEAFAKLFGMSKVNMGRYLNIATIPTWLFQLCPRSFTDDQGAVKAIWSLRKADELYLLFKENLGRIDGEVKSKLTQHQCDSPDDIIRILRKTLDKPVSTSLKVALNVDGKDVGYFETGKRKKTLKIFLSEDAPDDVVNEIRQILDKLKQ